MVVPASDRTRFMAVAKLKHLIVMEEWVEDIAATR